MTSTDSFYVKMILYFLQIHEWKLIETGGTNSNLDYPFKIELCYL